MINYCIYNNRTNIIVEENLASYEDAIILASKYDDHIVASNTTAGRLRGDEWANAEFFNF